MLNKDLISRVLNRALDILYLGYPLRTVFGLLLGTLFWVILHIFTPLLAIKGFVVDWVYNIGCFVVGVLIMNAKTIIEVFNGDAISEKYGSILRQIDKQTDLSEEQKRFFRSQLLSQEISKISESQVKEIKQRVIDK
ncbi:hypothetical protein QXC87_004525 [Escherichia coli]|nr:hypothetical protein [Escherichia coli]ELD1608935.1 hypothetical protein [Escherichia coli]